MGMHDDRADIRRRTCFFRVGDIGDYAYELIEGRVEMYVGADGRAARIADLGAGDVFGEMALIEERPRVLTAAAVTDGRATAMNRDEFEGLLTSDPARARRYLRSLFERLRSVTARLDDAGGESRDDSASPAATPELPIGHGAVSAWVVELQPLTPQAGQTVPDQGVSVARFPVRIGRVTGAHEDEALDLNDVWINDEKPFNVSRNHCEIAADRRGLLVRDRGSHLGCGVNSRWIGGRTPARIARLEVGDNELVIGSPDSPYRFQVRVRRA